MFILLFFTTLMFASAGLYATPDDIGSGINGPGKEYTGVKTIKIRSPRHTLKKVSANWVQYSPGEGVRRSRYYHYLFPADDFNKAVGSSKLEDAKNKTITINITSYRNIKGKNVYYCEIVDPSESKIENEVIEGKAHKFEYNREYTITVNGKRMEKRRFNFDIDWVYTPDSGVRRAKYDHYYFMKENWEEKLGKNPDQFREIRLKVKLKNKWSVRRGPACKGCQAPQGGFLDDNYRFIIVSVIQK